MPVPPGRSRGQTVEGLTRWLHDTVDEASEITVQVHPSPRSTGFSCETVLFDAQWRHAGESQRGTFAARVRPSGYSLYQEHDLDRQWRLIDAIGRLGAVPVPRIVGHATGGEDYLDQPFFVMERVEGVACADAPPYSIKGWLHDARPSEQQRVVERSIDILARIHAIPVPCLPKTAVERGVPVGIGAQVEAYGDFLAWVADGRDVPEFESAYRWLRDELPADPAMSFCWGDARIGNILFRHSFPVAVLDWEMAGLGPPEADLAWWMVFDRIHTVGRAVPRLPGFPDEAMIVERYQRKTGRAVQALRYYQVWAALRASVLLFRFHDMLSRHGMAPSDPQRAAYQPAIRVLRDLLVGEVAGHRHGFTAPRQPPSSPEDP